MTFKFTQQQSDWLDQCMVKSGRDSFRTAIFWLVEGYAKGSVGELTQALGVDERLKMLNLQLQVLLDKMGGSTPPQAASPSGTDGTLQGSELTRQPSAEPKAKRRDRR